ncbi:conjugal transfer protein TrbJ [Escherichia coli]|nr:conjugal transfer protein TrbJ [Escherichia coli]EEZ9363932.1 conjugal transfer protein TrbJ [Escherichia coli]EHB8077064.1 conjugal transfer protein TrbJ [Escherichia coli]EHJ7562438.1 conjugal transfer protein TrbJ [Escherichia coli]EHZ6539892.1 conjugal transfer protein TrbJ [Escherichia coli]
MKSVYSYILFILSLFITHNAIAAIPVVDPASIAKTVEEGVTRAKEAAANLQQLKEQYEQTIKYAEEQKRRLEGFTDFSNSFDSAESYMKTRLSDLTDHSKENVNSLRDKYNLKSESNLAQTRYDSILKQIDFYEKFNKSLLERANRMQNLQNSFSHANTPQQKADLANQLNTEKLTLEMQIKQYDIAERQLASQAAAEYEQNRQSTISAMFKH